MKILVTGAAGFIGKHLTQTLANEGQHVVAVDCFLPDSYDPRLKHSNAEELARVPNVQFVETDIRTELPQEIWNDVSTVVNLAAMPGLMKSWENFDLYESCNLLGVNRLIQQSLKFGINHFIQISTSSVYGSTAVGSEATPLMPSSPYGVTKLAGEKLVSAYGQSRGLPFSILRLFSVYGPGQRPDMAYHRFIESIIDQTEIVIYGDGKQSRSNTYVGDIVQAISLVVNAGPCNTALNVAGIESFELREVLTLIGEMLGQEPRTRFESTRPGDQRRTLGNISEITRLYGYQPQVSMHVGLAAQIDWHLAKRHGQTPIAKA